MSQTLTEIQNTLSVVTQILQNDVLPWFDVSRSSLSASDLSAILSQFLTVQSQLITLNNGIDVSLTNLFSGLGFSMNADATAFLKSDGSAIKNQCVGFVVFDSSQTVPVILKSFNVASLTRLSTGLFQIDFITPMADIDYATVGIGAWNTNTTNQATVHERTDLKTVSRTVIACTAGNSLTMMNFSRTMVLFFGGV